MSGACGNGYVEMAFDQSNPEAVRWARERSSTLITDITKSGRDSIRSVMERALAGELSPRDAAKLIRGVVGLTEQQSAAVLKLRAGLIAKGKTAAQAQQAAERYAAKLLRHRAATIARTETVAAANEGQLQLWKQARDRGLLGRNVKRAWVTTPGERTCPICKLLDGKTATLDGPFPGGFMNPPAHPNCRCATVLKADRRAA